MKATTRAILSALAGAGEAGELLLPLEQELYPEESVKSAADAFSGFCRVDLVTPGQQGERTLRLSVLPGFEEDHRRIFGELLNFLLEHSVLARLRSEASRG